MLHVFVLQGALESAQVAQSMCGEHPSQDPETGVLQAKRLPVSVPGCHSAGIFWQKERQRMKGCTADDACLPCLPMLLTFFQKTAQLSSENLASCKAYHEVVLNILKLRTWKRGREHGR